MKSSKRYIIHVLIEKCFAKTVLQVVLVITPRWPKDLHRNFVTISTSILDAFLFIIIITLLSRSNDVRISTKFLDWNGIRSESDWYECAHCLFLDNILTERDRTKNEPQSHCDPSLNVKKYFGVKCQRWVTQPSPLCASRN